MERERSHQTEKMHGNIRFIGGYENGSVAIFIAACKSLVSVQFFGLLFTLFLMLCTLRRFTHSLVDF